MDIATTGTEEISACDKIELSPDRIERYELMETLGNGGYGKVKLAKDVVTGKLYAIKIIYSKHPYYERAKVLF